jgi:predicted HicB family RNase H-like nuclease
MRRVRVEAPVKRGSEVAQKTVSKGSSPDGSADKGRMVHIRLDPELHRKLRLVVAAGDTTLQEWIARTLEDAADKAWPDIARGARR